MARSVSRALLSLCTSWIWPHLVRVGVRVRVRVRAGVKVRAGVRVGG